MKKLITGIFAAGLSIGVLTGVPVIELVATGEAEARVSKKQANRACRKKYGRKFIKSRISRSGKITCIYRKGTKAPSKINYQTVTAYCQKQHPFWGSIRAVKRNGKWYCTGSY